MIDASDTKETRLLLSKAASRLAFGSIVGMFFGPGAAELGAVWNLFDGTSTATGVIGAKKSP